METVNLLPFQRTFLAGIQRYGEYYIEFLETHPDDYSAIDTEYDNILAALDWNYETVNLSTVIKGVTLTVMYWSVRGLWNDAIKYLGMASQASAKAGDLKTQAFVSNHLGSFYRNMGDLPRALEFYNAALGFWNTASDRIGMAKAFGNLGIVRDLMGEKERAIELYHKSLEITEVAGEDAISANQYDNLGRLHSDRGEINLAERYFMKSLVIRKRLKNIQGIGRIYINLGIIHYQRCQWHKSLEYYLKARKIFEKVGDKHLLAMIYEDMGVAYHLSGKVREDWNQALELLQQSILLYKKLGTTAYGLAHTYFALGDLYLDMGEWEKAMNCYQDSQPIVDAEGIASANKGSPQLRMATVYLEMEQWERALELFEESRNWLELHEDKLQLIKLYGGLGEAYLHFEELEQALKYSELCLSLTNKLERGDPLGKALALRVLAKVYQYQGEYETAMNFFSEAQSMYLKLEVWYQLGKTYYEKGLCSKSRDRKTAMNCLEKAQSIFYSLGASKSLEKVTVKLSS